MDKNEYNLRLAEIEKYVDQGDYAAAAQGADTIEWKRVRNVRTLCMVSEIYEAVGRYDDSKKLLLRAYKRSPVGRSILYRLVEVTIHLKQFDEAIEYYTEYVQAAPHDNNRYILKYKIYRGRGSSIDEQIDILKEFLDKEYNEKYAYELARLYREADRIDECLTACDDLVLWFHSGKYVIKALELKKEYRPLTPKQQDIYDHRFDDEEDTFAAADDEEDTIGQEKKIVEAPETSETQAILDDTQREIAEEIAAATREAAEESVQVTEEQSEAEQTKEAVTEAAEETAAEQTAEEAAAEEEVPAEPVESVSPEVLASRVAESMRQITSGIGLYPTVDPDKEAADEVIEESKRVQEAAMAARGASEDEILNTASPVQNEMHMPRGLKLPSFDKKTTAAKKLTIDDVLLSMGERGEAVREAAAKANTEEKKQPEGVLSAVDMALLNIGAEQAEKEETEETAEVVSAPEETAEPTAEEVKEVAEAAKEEQEAAPVTEEKSEEPEEDEDMKIAPEKAEVKAPVLDQELSKEAEAVKEAGRELAAAFARDPKPEKEEAKEMPTEPEEKKDDILSAKTRVIPTEEIARIYGQTPIVIEEAEKEEVKAEEAAAETEKTEETEAAAEVEEKAEPVAAKTPQEAAEEAVKEVEASGNATVEDTARAAIEATAAPEMEQIDLDEEDPEEEAAEEAPAQEEEKKQAPRRRLAPQIRGLFDGFLEIDHLEDQIAYAIEQALAKNSERTSRAGNIVIFGGHGCGKTTLAVGIAKAIAQLRGDRAVKMARIYATDLNRKDIPKTIAKIAGGILIVEEAGDLDDQIADQLTTAMEFRTDGMIMILEDEQKYIRELLNRHPRFTMKFTSQIYIPIFTPNELIAFAQSHADEQGYTLSEGAENMLAEKIDKIGAEGEAVSIINMNELVDAAIVRANKFARKMFSGKNKYDELGRVILLDKDFK